MLTLAYSSPATVFAHDLLLHQVRCEEIHVFKSVVHSAHSTIEGIQKDGPGIGILGYSGNNVTLSADTLGKGTAAFIYPYNIAIIPVKDLQTALAWHPLITYAQGIAPRKDDPDFALFSDLRKHSAMDLLGSVQQRFEKLRQRGHLFYYPMRAGIYVVDARLNDKPVESMNEAEIADFINQIPSLQVYEVSYESDSPNPNDTPVARRVPPELVKQLLNPKDIKLREYFASEPIHFGAVGMTKFRKVGIIRAEKMKGKGWDEAEKDFISAREKYGVYLTYNKSLRDLMVMAATQERAAQLPGANRIDEDYISHFDELLSQDRAYSIEAWLPSPGGDILIGGNFGLYDPETGTLEGESFAYDNSLRKRFPDLVPISVVKGTLWAQRESMVIPMGLKFVDTNLVSTINVHLGAERVSRDEALALQKQNKPQPLKIEPSFFNKFGRADFGIKRENMYHGMIGGTWKTLARQLNGYKQYEGGLKEEFGLSFSMNYPEAFAELDKFVSPMQLAGRYKEIISLDDNFREKFSQSQKEGKAFTIELWMTDADSSRRLIGLLLGTYDPAKKILGISKVIVDSSIKLINGGPWVDPAKYLRHKEIYKMVKNPGDKQNASDPEEMGREGTISWDKLLLLHLRDTIMNRDGFNPPDGISVVTMAPNPYYSRFGGEFITEENHP
ncbi:MAG: hypothetical protein C5B49_11570 [Bdellovibrio sp.]|nr:MAG: hypothetical protein C5B49_11570 [Bdellovibrio sp.]